MLGACKRNDSSLMHNKRVTNQTSILKRSKADQKLIIFQNAQKTANTNLIPNQVGEENIKKYMRNENIERNKLIFMLLVHKHIFHNILQNLVHKHIFHNILQNEDLIHLFEYIIDRAWPKLNHLIQNLHIITDENSKRDIIWGEVIQLLTEDFTNLTEKEKELFFDRLFINQELNEHISDWQYSYPNEIEDERVRMIADATHLCIYINTEIIDHLSQHFINISGNTHTHPRVINDQKMQVLSKRLIIIESYQNIGRRDRQHKTQQTPDTNGSSIAESHEVEIGDIFRFSPT